MTFFEIFWAYSDTLAENGIEGFSYFSLPHFIWLFIMAAGIVLYAFSYCKGSEVRRNNLRKGMAVFLILFEFMQIGVMALTDAPVKYYLPLHMCSLAEFMILFDALWLKGKSRMGGQILIFEFLPAAFSSLVMPTSVIYPPYNFYVIHQFLLHGGIVAYIIAEYASGEIRPRYVGIWQAMLACYIEMFPIYFIDKAFDLNYMFLMEHWDNPLLKLLWDLSGKKGGIPYIFALSIMVIVFMHICYLIYRLIGFIQKKKSTI